MTVEIGTILLVEDDQDDVFSFKWALKKAGIANPVHLAEDGKAALSYLTGAGTNQDRPLPVLVFLDLKLPFHGGMEILTRMKADPVLASIPVVILSGSDETRDHNQAEALGAFDYIVKPPSPDQLTHVMKSAGCIVGPRASVI
jgi:CheY-like chemotaxis protein